MCPKSTEEENGLELLTVMVHNNSSKMMLEK